ncbi:MAG: septal ring lytic transglycosylase RlpA family protein [Desulfurivibrionaceae bacterium]
MVSVCSKVIRPYSLISIVSVFLFAMLLVLSGCGSHKNYKPHPELTGYSESGKASYYSMKYQFRKTASGERFNNYAMTAAHETLPFGTDVLVTNLGNGKTATVTINDRGPFVEGRIIDLSRAAFSKIASIDQGVAEVEIKVVN